jgi:arabinan endo-1,5-alpha-L-arabinosidase
MILHVRKIFWTQNGWPIVSPERYAWEDNAAVAKDSITGQWVAHQHTGNNEQIR